MIELINTFSNLRSKQQKELRDMSYNLITNNIVISMFNHTNDSNIPSELIEKFLTEAGCVSFGYSDGMWIPFVPSFTGDIGIDGLGTEIEGVSLNGAYFFHGSRKEFPVMFNNSEYIGEWPITTRIADALSQTSISMISNVKLCRAKASILAATEQEKKAATKILDDIEEGKILTVILDRMKSASGGQSGYDMLNLGDIKDIDKLQYLTKFFDDVVRMTMQIYGIPINSSGKMAQMNDMELNGYQLYSQIYPKDRMRQRQRFYEEFNALHGLNWGVEWNSPWDVAMSEKMVTDVMGDDTSPEPEEEGDDDDEDSEGLD